MSQNLTISETGFKLIKAFEGYRPVDRELVSGQRIVGYGHRLYSEDAVMMNKSEAESVLRTDLEPFEDMINSEVHAPMTQSQFDALCSFAFNIGPKAFLQSDTLRAINNGRPLDAANGLDVWRKSEIDGKTYVVDALMRRRTAEKALFLRTERSVSAGREDLPPVKDTALAGLSTDDGLPVFTEKDANGIVATAPYAANTNPPSRRREDGPAGMLQLSERDIVDENSIDELESSASDIETQSIDAQTSVEDIELETLDLDTDASGSDDTPAQNLNEAELDVQDDAAVDAEPRKSPIAAAATDIVARLDALIEDVDVRFEDLEDDRPDSLIENGEFEIQDDIQDDIQDKLQDDLHSNETFEDEAQDNIIEISEGETLASRIMNERITRKDNVDTVDVPLNVQKETTVAVIDELSQDDSMRVRTDSAAKYIEQTQPASIAPEPVKQSSLGLWVLVLLGFILVGLAVGAMISGSENLLGEWGHIITFTGFVIGVGLILAGVYSALRMNLRS